MSRFEEVHRSLIVAVAHGLTFGEACERCGVPVETGRGWLKRGRNEDAGPYHLFARAVDEAHHSEPAVMDEYELLSVAAARARAGSVAAMRLVWDLIRNDPEGRDDDPLAGVDALARRRLLEGRETFPRPNGDAG